MKGRKAMNWKKKLLALGLSLTLTLSLTACGQKRRMVQRRLLPISELLH